MTDLAEALARPDQPHATYAKLEALVDATIGVRLFTLLEVDRTGGVARRSHSNMPDAYPTSGEKSFEPNDWTAAVLDRHETFVANTIDEIAAVFPDHDLIRSLGCESCINIPVVIAGQVVGTLNCLAEAGHYTPDRVAASERLKLPGALAFLLAASLRPHT